MGDFPSSLSGGWEEDVGPSGNLSAIDVEAICVSGETADLKPYPYTRHKALRVLCLKVALKGGPAGKASAT